MEAQEKSIRKKPRRAIVGTNKRKPLNGSIGGVMSGDRAFKPWRRTSPLFPRSSSVRARHDASVGWWVKFGIDIEHPLAWHVVQELGHVLNYISIDERLPRVFMPVSPPPYLNGGPKEFLSWVIERSEKVFKPRTVAKSLEGLLPRPVDDLTQWDSTE